MLGLQRAAGNAAVRRAVGAGERERHECGCGGGAAGPCECGGAEHEVVRPLRRSGRAPIIARQPQPPQQPQPVNPDARGCYSDRSDGQGQLVEVGPEIARFIGGGPQAYAVWGVWRRGDTPASYVQRTFSRWIAWRFGSGLSGDVQAAIVRIARAQWSPPSQAVPDDCLFPNVMSLATLNRITVLANRDPAARAAGQREAQAGLPPAGAAATLPPAAGAEEQETEEPETPVPRLGSEFEGGTSQRRANQPALPARITGPDFGALGGINSYRMELEYWPAGFDLLSQVVEAMNWVDYHWERYDITALARIGLAEQAARQRRQQAVSTEAEVGRMAAAGRRAEHAGEELGEQVEAAGSELAHPVEAAHGGTPGEVVIRAMANVESLELLPASEIVAAGGVALGALADLMGGTFQEREIPWPRRSGVFLVRCIAAPSPQGAHGELVRIPSVATKIVEVQPPAQLARGGLDEPEAQVAEKALQLELERHRRPPNEARVQTLEHELADLRTSTGGTVLEALDVAIRQKTEARDLATGRRRDDLQRELDVLTERRARAERSAALAQGPVYRPRVSFASKVTGETYPLLLQLFETSHEGGVYTYELSDETSRDARRYTGRGPTAAQAAWNAFLDLGDHAEYGLGEVAVRMPAGSPFALPERTVHSAPRGEALVRQRLNDLVTVLVILGLFVPGVGEVAAVVGAAVAADRLIDRWRNDSLRFDAAAVSDLIAILGAVGQGAAAIGRLRVVRAADQFVLAAAEGNEAALREAVSAFSAARQTARAIDIANQIVGWGGFAWGAANTAGEIIEINEAELNGRISHAEARRRRADKIAGALRDGVIQFAGAAHTEHPQTAPPEHAAPTSPERTAPAERPPAPEHGGTPHEGQAETPHGDTVDPSRASGQPGTTITGEEHVRARATTPDGLHQIIVLNDGRVVRCSSPACAVTRAHYEDFLREQRDPSHQPEEALRNRARDFETRMNDLDARAAATTDPAEAQRIADEVARLDQQLREYAAQALAPELGVHDVRLRTMLELWTAAELRALRAFLGADLFGHLAGRRDPNVIREFAHALELVGADPVARDELRRSLDLSRHGVSEADLGTSFRELNRFLERYGSRVSGDFVSRWRRAVRARGDPVQARAELSLAADLLEGRTPLAAGQDLHVSGLQESTVPGEKTPEYRVTDADGASRLAEVKRLNAALTAGNIETNLRQALSQIISTAERTGERGGFVRLDAPGGNSTLSPEQVRAAVEARLRSVRPDPVDPSRSTRGLDFVEWVEVLYRDSTGTQQRVLCHVVAGSVVIAQ